jgi:hypothetical protein
MHSINTKLKYAKFKLTLFLCFAFYLIHSQNTSLPQQLEIGMPISFGSNDAFPSKDYIKRISKERRPKYNQEYWFVYSNSDGTPVYDAPNGKGNRISSSKLKFLERLVVTDKDNDWVQVATYETTPTGFPSVKGLKFKGWVKFDQILVCASAPSNKNALPQKAMSIMQFESGSFKDGTNLEKIYNVFLDPELKIQDKDENGNEVKVNANDIYYIFDRKLNAYLIGKNSRLTTMNNAELTKAKEIIGWISDLAIQKIDTRVCYEPNWEIEAQNEYKGEKVKVFRDYEHAKNYVKNGALADPVKEWELTGTRLPGHIFRLFQTGRPYDETGIIPVAFVGRLAKNNSSEIIYTGDELDKVTSKLEHFKDKNSRLNIMIVIDGTKSMKSYFKPLADALSNSMKEINSRLKNNDLVKSVKIGAVVYRDYPDYNIKPMEILPLSKDEDATKISKFLNSIECNSIDVGDEEAVYQGILEGIKQLPENEKNVIILVGDAGNHRNDSKYTLDEVIKAACKKDVNFIAFQANNNQKNSAYELFNIENKDIIIACAKNYNKNSGTVSNEKKNKPSFDNTTDKDENWITTRLDLFPEIEGIEGYAMFAEVTAANQGKSISSETLRKKIENNIYSVYDGVKELIKKTTDVEKTREMDPAMTLIFKNSGFTDNDIKLLCNNDFRYQGYIARKTNKNNFDGYKAVVFMEETEFFDFLNILDGLDNLESADLRVGVYDAFMKQLLKTYGENENNISGADKSTRNVLDEKTLNQVWMDLFGIEYAEDKSKIYRMKDLKNKEAVDDEWINNFYNKITQKYKSLKRYRNLDYPYKTIINGHKFFWIDRKELP